MKIFETGKGDIINVDVASTGKFILTVHSDVHLILWDLKGKVLATINTNQVSFISHRLRCFRFEEYVCFWKDECS